MIRRSRLALFWALLLLLAAGIAARIALPGWIQRTVNDVLDRGGAYSGRIGDVDVALWRGLYSIEDVEIWKRDGEIPVPLLAAPRVDLSIRWAAIFRGALVGEIWLDEPQLNFVNGPRRSDRQTGAGGDWRAKVEELFPLRIDRVSVRNGRVHYRDFHRDPKVNVHLDALYLEARNLTNSVDLSGSRVASIEMRAVPMRAGQLAAAARLDPFAAAPSFDLDVTVQGARLAQWNDFFRAYAGFDVQRGNFALYGELLAEDGRFDGYVKPFVEDLDVLDLRAEQQEQGLLASLWEAVVGAGAEVLEDQPRDRQAARVPISGSVKDPSAEFWPALGSALRNAFLESLPPRLERSIGNDG